MGLGGISARRQAAKIASGAFRIDRVNGCLVATVAGVSFIFDVQDEALLRRFSWRVSPGPRLTRQVGTHERNIRNIYVYHDIIGVDPSRNQFVDHINGDSTDNRRCNLRSVTPSQNSRNRYVGQTNRSGFKGVEIKKNRFRARIKVGDASVGLGSFLSAEDAARAYDAAARQHFGPFARLNFPQHGEQPARNGARDHG